MPPQAHTLKIYVKINVPTVCTDFQVHRHDRFYMVNIKHTSLNFVKSIKVHLFSFL